MTRFVRQLVRARTSGDLSPQAAHSLLVNSRLHGDAYGMLLVAREMALYKDKTRLPKDMTDLLAWGLAKSASHGPIEPFVNVLKDLGVLRDSRTRRERFDQLVSGILGPQPGNGLSTLIAEGTRFSRMVRLNCLVVEIEKASSWVDQIRLFEEVMEADFRFNAPMYKNVLELPLELRKHVEEHVAHQSDQCGSFNPLVSCEGTKIAISQADSDSLLSYLSQAKSVVGFKGVSSVLLESTLRSCFRSSKLHQAEDILRLAVDSEITLNETVFDDAMNAYVVRKLHHNAVSLFQLARNSNTVMSALSYEIGFSLICNTDSILRVWHELPFAMSKGFKPSPTLMLSLLPISAPDQATLLWNCAVKYARFVDFQLCSRFVKVFHEAKDPMVLSVYDYMLDNKKHKLSPNATIHNCALECYLRQSDFERAGSIVSLMNRRKIPMNDHSYTLLGEADRVVPKHVAVELV